VRVPLLENRPFAKALTLNVSDRFAEYAPQGSANAYNFGVEWSPIDAMRFRGTLSRAVRARPMVTNCFSAKPCPRSLPAIPAPMTRPPAGRAHRPRPVPTTGVTAAQYGKIAPAKQLQSV